VVLASAGNVAIATGIAATGVSLFVTLVLGRVEQAYATWHRLKHIRRETELETAKLAAQLDLNRAVAAAKLLELANETRVLERQLNEAKAAMEEATDVREPEPRE